MLILHTEFASHNRGYSVTLERDLFDAYVLYRRWYGLFTRKRGQKIQYFLKEEDALAEVSMIGKRRARNGYAQRDSHHYL